MQIINTTLITLGILIFCLWWLQTLAYRLKKPKALAFFLGVQFGLFFWVLWLLPCAHALYHDTGGFPREDPSPLPLLNRDGEPLLPPGESGPPAIVHRGEEANS